MTLVFKICTAGEWCFAEAQGAFTGSTADLRDGFIHLSTADQLPATAARHFAGQTGLVVVAFEAEGLAHLKWEASRDGALFPHVYGSLPAAAALWLRDLPLENGRHRLPQGLVP